MDTQMTHAAQARSSRINFSGRGSEFFGIWIVNVLLSILTLGIYSAWAKVRTLQYFYGHTQIDGHAFRYLATPMQILKGRLMAVGLFLVISLLTNLFPLIAIIAAIAFLFIMPWLLIMGVRFNLRMTSYRNVRFGFQGGYGDAMINFMLLPFLSIFTLYLALPWVLKRLDQYVFGNTTFMAVKALWSTPAPAVITRAALLALLVCVGLVAVGIVIAVALQFNNDALDIKTAPWLFAPLMLAYLALLTLTGAVYQAMIRNHLFNNTTLPELATFQSDIPVLKLFQVSLTNLLLIAVSCGLAYPFAKIRISRLLAAHTEVTVYPALDLMRDQLAAESSAFAEDAAGLYDADFSLT